MQQHRALIAVSSIVHHRDIYISASSRDIFVHHRAISIIVHQIAISIIVHHRDIDRQESSYMTTYMTGRIDFVHAIMYARALAIRLARPAAARRPAG